MGGWGKLEDEDRRPMPCEKEDRLTVGSNTIQEPKELGYT